jgi:CRP-like cAMP-binding protein
MLASDYARLSVNRILAALPDIELRRVAWDGEVREMNKGDVTQHAGERIELVVFPLGCLISMRVELLDGTSIEAATIGREGFASLPVFFGAHTATLRGEVKLPGRALLVDCDQFRGHIEKNPELCSLLGRYAELLFVESAQVNACSRAHSIQDRCVRWLLTAADQLGAETVPTTQAELAQSLGVRRASVTDALNSLEQRGLISIARGRLAIRDRRRLRAAACECYDAIARQFEQTSW